MALLLTSLPALNPTPQTLMPSVVRIPATLSASSKAPAPIAVAVRLLCLHTQARALQLDIILVRSNLLSFLPFLPLYVDAIF
jgi:hypothetical protein